MLLALEVPGQHIALVQPAARKSGLLKHQDFVIG